MNANGCAVNDIKFLQVVADVMGLNLNVSSISVQQYVEQI